jgi:hypothetical protein
MNNRVIVDDEESAAELVRLGENATVEQLRSRRRPVTLADAINGRFEHLKRLVTNLLVDNKNFQSGHYVQHVPTTSQFIREVLPRWHEGIEGQIDALQELVDPVMRAFEDTDNGIERGVVPRATDEREDLPTIAWTYDLATTKDANGYSGWQRKLSFERPNVPEGSIRNLVALADVSRFQVLRESVAEHLVERPRASASEVEVFAGYLDYDGASIEVEFAAPVNATAAEKDAAFMAALAQRATIEYLPAGEPAKPEPKWRIVKVDGNSIESSGTGPLDGTAMDVLNEIEYGLSQPLAYYLEEDRVGLFAGERKVSQPGATLLIAQGKTQGDFFAAIDAHRYEAGVRRVETGKSDDPADYMSVLCEIEERIKVDSEYKAAIERDFPVVAGDIRTIEAQRAERAVSVSPSADPAAKSGAVDSADYSPSF